MAATDPVQVRTLDEVEPLPYRTAIAHVTPVSPLDGGDGTHTTSASKQTAYVWAPFASLYNLAPPPIPGGTVTDTTLDDTAVIAAGLANI